MVLADGGEVGGSDVGVFCRGSGSAEKVGNYRNREFSVDNKDTDEEDCEGQDRGDCSEDCKRDGKEQDEWDND